MYELILFPENQIFMEYDWFDKECFLAQPTNEDQDWVGNSAYFIPKERIKEHEQII